ncbi:MAG: hypothetical protein AAF715_17345 [Myxococcota bacterium]
MREATWPAWGLVGACVVLAGACGSDADVGGADPASSSVGVGGGSPTTSGGTGGEAPPLADPQVYVQLGDDVTPTIRDRVLELLAGRTSLPLSTEALPDAVHPDSRIIAIGDTPSTRAVIPLADLEPVGSEGFVVKTGTHLGVDVLAADGRPTTDDPFGHSSLGDGFAAYAALEELGFGFLHPLAPSLPAAVTWPSGPVDHRESPRWPVRGLHLHTMHPLELTHVLNGWGPLGPDDAAGFETLVPEWESFVEWLVANRQNRVTWALLESASWAEFAESETRQTRLASLVDIAHEYGVAVGIDAPIVLQQQHAFRLITDTGELSDEVAQLRSRVDYLMAMGLDFLKTESGTTEFTSPDDTRMLAWMDALTDYADQMYGAEVFIKVHASTGQTADNFVDPDTQEPLNFNFLPHYADPRLGVLPHTVQHYSLDDPAPTYGNTDFAYIREFLQEEAGARPTVWYPETAYWVSFDVDVPLFLPVYGHRRFHDLRLLAADEDGGLMGRGPHAGATMDGQLTFSSGWEWGYWLHEVVTARAASDPHTEIADERAALKATLAPALRVFGDAAAPLTELLLDAMETQHRLLILGEVAGQAPSEIEKRSGQAYLQGVESWDDVADLTGSIGLHTTQPDRLGLVEMRNPFHAPPGYSAEVEPLLAEMETKLAKIADDLEALRPQVAEVALPLFDDLADAARVTALRATQIHNLYDYVDGWFDTPQSTRQMQLDAARTALDDALVIVQQRESQYRADPARIAGWADNPTAYEYGYLWTVRSLYFWFRDEGKAVDAPISPCYRNLINPVDIGFGEGLGYDLTNIITDVFDANSGIGGITACLSHPASEPSFGHSKASWEP